jgi:hypothetical protein
MAQKVMISPFEPLIRKVQKDTSVDAQPGIS